MSDVSTMVERALAAFEASLSLKRGRMCAALQAALDPNDEDLVLICFNAMHDEWGVEENARAAIAALRAAALGDET